MKRILLLDWEGHTVATPLHDSGLVQVARLINGPVDCIALGDSGIDMWTLDTTRVPWTAKTNRFATQVHSAYSTTRTVFYGAVVFTGRRTDPDTEAVDIDGLTDDQMLTLYNLINSNDWKMHA